MQAITGDLLELDDTSAALLNGCYRSMILSDILSLFRNTFPDAPETLEWDIAGDLESIFASNIIDVGNRRLMHFSIYQDVPRYLENLL